VKVIVTTDEPLVTPKGRPEGESETWWAEIKKLGWVWIDHGKERTSEIHGAW
jgi:hypothetical protein